MHQIDVVTDVTLSLGKGVKKSIKSYSKEAGRVARSVGEFVDVEDVLKSIHKVAHPEQHAERKSSVVHKPMDWSSNTHSPFQEFSKDMSQAIEEENIRHNDTRSGHKPHFTRREACDHDLRTSVQKQSSYRCKEPHNNTTSGSFLTTKSKRAKERLTADGFMDGSKYRSSKKSSLSSQVSTELRNSRWKDTKARGVQTERNQPQHSSSATHTRRLSAPAFRRKLFSWKSDNLSTIHGDRQQMRKTR